MPNPATHFFRVHFETHADGPIQLRPLDATGRVVFTRHAHGARHTAWNIGALRAGVYWMVVMRGTGLEARQVVVE